jgi:glycosyltransferase involved in cell wall biosynthesis
VDSIRVFLPGVLCVTHKLVIVTEIIAPYRIPVFNALAQRPEIDLHVIFLSESDPALRQWLVYKEEIKFPYDVLPSWRQRFGKYNILLNRGMHSSLSRIQPDVVVCGGYNYPASWTAARWAKAHRVPFLLWTESTAFDLRRRYRVVEFIKKRFLKMCAAFVVPGKSSLHYLQDLGIPAERIATAPNAVDTTLFSKLAEAARHSESQVRARHRLPARYFLYVGRLVKAKGVFDLLHAYSQLNPEIRSSVGLVLVGDGSDRQQLVELAANITPGTIQIPGFAHREQLSEIYALADGFIFPTHSDPWGLVVNEAMACGLPVLATTVAGCTLDLVQDGWNGFVVPPRDPTRLAAAMENLAIDSTLRTEMGRRSRERVESYSPAAWARGMLEAVQSVRSPQD